MNLLGRARKMLQGLGPSEPTRPQYYDVACPEGHRMSGQRTEGYQALRCPTCGEGIFILPISPLPDPPAPKDKTRRPSTADGPLDEGPLPLSDPPTTPEVELEDDESEVEWLEPSPEEAAPRDDGFEAIIPKPGDDEPRPAPRPRPSQATAKATSAPRRKPATATNGERKPAPMPGTILIAERPGLRERIWRARHVLILLGVVGLVGGTIGYRLWRKRLENLPQVAETNLAEGTAALEAGDFPNAKFKLRKAADALERLGADNAIPVRQSAEEAAILADRVDPPLEELLDEAVRAKSPEEWQDRFETRYKGRAILIDDTIRLPEGVAKGAYELNYRVIAGPKTFGQIDLKGLTLMDSKTFKDGEPITFGARLAAITLEPDGSWRIALEPDSGIFMTDAKALSLIEGWPTAESQSAEEAAR